jgi:hypothetical protein
MRVINLPARRPFCACVVVLAAPKSQSGASRPQRRNSGFQKLRQNTRGIPLRPSAAGDYSEENVDGETASSVDDVLDRDEIGTARLHQDVMQDPTSER